MIFLDAGIFIGALLKGDERHNEARQIVDSARKGELLTCTTVGVLSEVYAALTWIHAEPPHKPCDAANAVRLCVEEPSAIQVLNEHIDVYRKMLELAEKYNLTARRIHDARHAANAILHGVRRVYTYDVHDWKLYELEGLKIAGPPTIVSQ